MYVWFYVDVVYNLDLNAAMRAYATLSAADYINIIFRSETSEWAMLPLTHRPVDLFLLILETFPGQPNPSLQTERKNSG